MASSTLRTTESLSMIDRSAPAAIVFDGDDTLWETELLYDHARSDAARVAASAGYDPDLFEALQRSIDARNVQAMGLSPKRFPASSVEAFTALAERAGAVADPAIVERIRRASAAVFEAQAPLVPFAEELLESLTRSFRLVLLTKGEESVQRRRVATSGLRDYFEDVEIVPTKDADTFLRLLRRMGAEAGASWSIGNSLVSDVAPALAAGMQAIWIDSHVWVHERRAHGVDLTDPRLHIGTGLTDVPSILGAAVRPVSAAIGRP